MKTRRSSILVALMLLVIAVQSVTICILWFRPAGIVRLPTPAHRDPASVDDVAEIVELDWSNKSVIEHDDDWHRKTRAALENSLKSPPKSAIDFQDYFNHGCDGYLLCVVVHGTARTYTLFANNTRLADGYGNCWEITLP
jgi:hypothetical protein